MLINVIINNNKISQSLQKLSSSSSNNRLKTCLQFLIIKVNENKSNGNNSTIERSTTTTTPSSATNDDHDHRLTWNGTLDSQQIDLINPSKLRLRATSLTSRSQTNARRFNQRQQLNLTTCKPIKYNDNFISRSSQLSPTHGQVSSSQDRVIADDNNNNHHNIDHYDHDHKANHHCGQWQCDEFINHNQNQEFDFNLFNNYGNKRRKSEIELELYKDGNDIINNDNDTVEYNYPNINSHYYYECQIVAADDNPEANKFASKRLKDCSTSTDNISYVRRSPQSAFNLIISSNTNEINTSNINECKMINGQLDFAHETTLGAFTQTRTNEHYKSDSDSEIDDNFGDKPNDNSNNYSDNDDSMQSCLSSSSYSTQISTSSCCSCSTSSCSTCSHKSCLIAKIGFINNFSKEIDESFLENNNNSINDHPKCNGVIDKANITASSQLLRPSKLRLDEQLLQNIGAKPIQFKTNLRLARKKSNLTAKHEESRIDCTSATTVNLTTEHRHTFREKPNLFQTKQLIDLQLIMDNNAIDAKEKDLLVKSPCSKSSDISSPKIIVETNDNNADIVVMNDYEDLIHKTKCANWARFANDCKIQKTVNTVAAVELLKCTICGIREKASIVSHDYGPICCTICAKYFGLFLRKPRELFCAQDGNCLMTFDSRCRACWIKLCLQKLNLTEEQRDQLDLNHNAPKLLSAPNLTLL